MSTVRGKRVPRKTLLIPSAVGFCSVLAVAIEGRGLAQLALWLLVICFAVALAIELLALPLALWRLLSNPVLRTRANAACITVAAIFLLSAVVQIAV